MIECARLNEQSPIEALENPRTTQEVILEAELDLANRELKDLEGKSG